MKKKKGSVLLFRDFGTLEFSDIKADEDGYKPIPIFREGIFEHPWYGNLDFDNKYLTQIVKNHEKGVMPAQISFDQSHNPDLGALAWVKPGKGGVFTEQVTYTNSLGDEVTKEFLFAMIKLTKVGQQKIDDEEFKYFSSEINPDYSTREVVQLDGADGKEAGHAPISHGPTLIGGGFTNRPFIPNLGEAFSEDGKPLEEGEIHTLTKNDDKTFFFSDAVKPREPVPVPVAAVEKVEITSTELTEPIGENRMEFSEVIAKLNQFSTPQEKVKCLEEVLPELGDESKAIAEALLKSNREAAQFSLLASDAAHKANLAESRVTQLNEKNLSLSNDLLASKEIGYQEKVKAFSASVRADGHGEAVVKAVEEVLSGVEPSNRDMSFSAIAEDGTASNFDIFEAVTKIFSALPEAAKAIQEPAFSNEPAAADDTNVEVKPAAAQEFDTPAEPTADEVAALETASRVEKYTERCGEAPHPNFVQFLDGEGHIDHALLDNAARN